VVHHQRNIKRCMLCCRLEVCAPSLCCLDSTACHNGICWTWGSSRSRQGEAEKWCNLVPCMHAYRLEVCGA
jgi:hypothetical protein